MDNSLKTVIEQTVRQEWGRLYANLVQQFNDFDLAEEALQEALVAALEHWPHKGLPGSPAAWLLQTARRKAIDRLRRRHNFEQKRETLQLHQQILMAPSQTPLPEQQWPEQQWPEQHSVINSAQAVEGLGGGMVEGMSDSDLTDQQIDDERLRLIFTCCHPALAAEAQVALTLRTLGGLSTTEIARAFLLPDTTLAQRLVRAKRKIKMAGIPYRVPDAEQWPERLSSVLAVVYLIFNEGYSATLGDSLCRHALCEEAIRLARLLTQLIKDNAEVTGLLALMLLHEARRKARTDAGAYVSLEDQDRNVWDRDKIEAGLACLDRTLTLGAPGPYQIQAAISAVHVKAGSFEETDWRQIMLLYQRLYQMQPSPVIKLNTIVALSFYRGAEAGLAALEAFSQQSNPDGFGDLKRYQPFHAARADMLARAGRTTEAIAAYDEAIKYSTNSVEREFLQARQLSQ